ncbi:hypothetical protein, partial [Streptomyces albogriseolus]|uniref:hypothetical protein n=1 Tax=Streptomyces albogriseolus TaxID=1887 RepID=UPI003460AF70
RVSTRTASPSWSVPSRKMPRDPLPAFSITLRRQAPGDQRRGEQAEEHGGGAQIEAPAGAQHTGTTLGHGHRG